MNKTQRWVLIAALILAFILLGFLRDFIFINLNYHLAHLKTEGSRSIAHSFFDFLNQFTFMQVYYSKYVITLLFTILNFLLGYFLIRIVLSTEKLLRLYAFLYIAVTAAALLFFAGGFIVGDSDQGYSFSRILMGFLQSPVPAALLIFGYPLYRKS